MATTDITDSRTGEQALLPLTPAEIEGPFFRIGAPRRESLLEPGITGERLMLSGRVLTPEGKVIPHRRCSSSGCPTMKATMTVRAIDSKGYTVTDASGRYHMEMIVPACYEPRQAQHVHVKVQGVWGDRSRPSCTSLERRQPRQRSPLSVRTRRRRVRHTPGR